MKKIFTIAAVAAATILAVSCAKEDENGPQTGGIIVHASLQPVDATKAIGEYSYNIVWEENDKIAVLDKDNNKASFKLTAGASTTTGTFEQEGTDALTAPLTAYYPASVVAEDKSLVWPATQADVENISNVPMTAESSTATGDVNFAFKHLGSVLQLVLTAKNGTINVKQIDITADQGLSGEFTVENSAAKISSTGTTITTGDISAKKIKLSATASYLNFAVPSGSFTNFKITITDTKDKTYSLSAANLSLKRAMVNKVTFAMDAKGEIGATVKQVDIDVVVPIHPSSLEYFDYCIVYSDNNGKENRDTIVADYGGIYVEDWNLPEYTNNTVTTKSSLDDYICWRKNFVYKSLPVVCRCEVTLVPKVSRDSVVSFSYIVPKPFIFSHVIFDSDSTYDPIERSDIEGIEVIKFADIRIGSFMSAYGTYFVSTYRVKEEYGGISSSSY